MSVIKRWNEDVHNKQLKETIDKLGADARNLQQIIAKACIFWSWEQKCNHNFAIDLPF